MPMLHIEGHEVLDGIRTFLPFSVPIVVFGLFFGATTSESGLGFWQILFTSAIMYAGASQFVFVDMLGYQVPAWSIILTVTAVNFRKILYSASLSRYLENFSLLAKFLAFFFIIDHVMAESSKRAQHRSLTPEFYFGYSIVAYIAWLVTSGVGALFGTIIQDPRALGLDLFVTIFFLILVMGFRSRPNWAWIVLTSGCASLMFYYTVGPPWHISLGALVGMATAVLLVRPNLSVGDGA